MIAVAFLLAAGIGLSLGLLGGGGSILTVPVLVYVLGVPAKAAIAMSLPVVGVTSALSAVMHWRRGNVRIVTALTFGAIAMAGAFVGAKVSVRLGGGVQLAALGFVMLAASASMLRQGPTSSPVGDPTRATTSRLAVLVPIAFVVGALTGVVGIGGGFLVVPALVLLARVPMREAVGTSLLVIAMNSAAGFVGYMGTMVLDWKFLAGFTAVAVAGAFVGTALTGRVSQASLKRGFGVLLLLMGAFVVLQNRNLLL